MKNQKWNIHQVMAEINSAMEGSTPIEKALMLAEVLSDTLGNRWEIKASEDGSFKLFPCSPNDEASS